MNERKSRLTSNQNRLHPLNAEQKKGGNWKGNHGTVDLRGHQVLEDRAGGGGRCVWAHEVIEAVNRSHLASLTSSPLTPKPGNPP